MPLLLRPARLEDGAAAQRLLRRSIIELCTADHHTDPKLLIPWLRSKTRAAWRRWLARQDARLLVAEAAGRLLGTAMIDQTGMVLLLYVSPAARFEGVSTALLAALEDEARRFGARRCRLESTQTAAGFYRARGYLPASGPGLWLEKPLETASGPKE